MSEPYDYTPPQPSAWGAHLPILLLAISFSVYLGAQILESRAAGNNMHYALQNTDKQIENVKAAQKGAEEQASKQADSVKLATQLETQYNSLFGDLFDLAKDDDDAKKVVQKWKIQRPTPPAEEPKKEGITIGK